MGSSENWKDKTLGNKANPKEEMKRPIQPRYLHNIKALLYSDLQLLFYLYDLKYKCLK